MGVFCSTTRSGWVASPQLTAWGAGGGDGKGPSRGCVTSFIFLLPELFVLRAAVRFISGTFLRSLSVCLSVCLFAGRGRCSDWAGYIPDPSVGDATEAVRGAESHIFVGPFLYKTDQFTKTGLVAR